MVTAQRCAGMRTDFGQSRSRQGQLSLQHETEEPDAN
jgi:hypothetical protein